MCIGTHHRRLLLLMGAILWVPISARAGEPFQVGSVTVQTHGEHGQALILIPGLSSGGWVWDDLVNRLQADHVIYVLTLAGFDGTAPAQGKLFDLAGESLLQLIQTRKLNRPVLIGHSLGGTLSLQFAQQHSDLIGGVIAIDGLPVFPGMESVPPAQRAAIGENMRLRMANMNHEQFADQQAQFMQTRGVRDQAKAVELAAKMARSDPAAAAAYMAQDLALDLRPALPAIKVPVLEICPYNPDDEAKPDPAAAQKKVEYYRELLRGTPALEVISIAPSKHFVMFDQPDALAAAVKKFLATASATTAPSSQPH
jgi:pimeloyl-ACP methyl ester carboxylesterase